MKHKKRVKWRSDFERAIKAIEKLLDHHQRSMKTKYKFFFWGQLFFP
jgi:hypothetical protein